MNLPGQADYQQHIREVMDFPKPGICFYDIAPLIGNGAVFASLIGEMADPLKDKVNKIVGFDARGFIFGAAMAARIGAGCVMLRKAGKLPGDTHRTGYDLEYGNNELEIQSDALGYGDNVAMVDDIIATGGTALAGVELVRKCGANIIEFCAVIDLPDLGGSRRLVDHGVAVRIIVER